MTISKTGARRDDGAAAVRRRAWLTDLDRPSPASAGGRRPKPAPNREHNSEISIAQLAQEWYLDLRIMGRSEKTILWYRSNVDAYVAAAGNHALTNLTALAVKRHLSELQELGRAANTVHGRFQVLKSLACWA